MIWQACEGSQQIGALRGQLWRLVESQEQVATLGFVDTLEEQALLETLLEQAKPPYPADGSGLHYLLRTPFRYPPLKWGSRFGGTHEPSLFYGGASVTTTLAESAYYRALFWYSMASAPGKRSMRTQHTLFSAAYATDKGVQLQRAPFDAHRDVLTDPRDYRACQALGSAMREAGVVAFQYRSARDPQDGLCVGLFAPEAFSETRPREMTQWFCETTAEEVAFKQAGVAQVHRFPVQLFQVDGELPLPA